jgi:uridine kinase
MPVRKVPSVHGLKHEAAIAAADAALLIERARVESRKAGAPAHAPLVGLSGIDGSGKSTFAAAVVAALARRGLRIAALALDLWHRPRAERMGGTDPAQRFYDRAYRFDELFTHVLEPLRRTRSVRAEADALDVASDGLVRRTWEFKDIDLILLEGIFLFRRDLAARFDRRWWIDCSPRVATTRALARNQEGLDGEALRLEYETVYEPAQRLHFKLDYPVAHADLVFENG